MFRYPRYPATSSKPSQAPRDRDGSPLFIAEYDSSFDFQSSFSNGGENDHPGCGDRRNITEESLVTLDSLYSDSEQGPEYVAQRQAWLADFYTFAMDDKSIKLLPLGGKIETLSL